jgi:hypothetical protein
MFCLFHLLTNVFVIPKIHRLIIDKLFPLHLDIIFKQIFLGCSTHSTTQPRSTTAPIVRPLFPPLFQQITIFLLQQIHNIFVPLFLSSFVVETFVETFVERFQREFKTTHAGHTVHVLWLLWCRDETAQPVLHSLCRFCATGQQQEEQIVRHLRHRARSRHCSRQRIAVLA